MKKTLNLVCKLSPSVSLQFYGLSLQLDIFDRGKKAQWERDFTDVGRSLKVVRSLVSCGCIVTTILTTYNIFLAWSQLNKASSADLPAPGPAASIPVAPSTTSLRRSQPTTPASASQSPLRSHERQTIRELEAEIRSLQDQVAELRHTVDQQEEDLQLAAEKYNALVSGISNVLAST